MKYLFCILLACSLSLSGEVFAQEKQKRFFLPNFQEAQVYYKDGRTFRITANYDLVAGSFVFIDSEDGNQLKLFGQPEQIGCVKINGRTFYATRFGPTEIVQAEPEFCVYYQSRILDGGKDVGYGMKSNSSATRTYSHFYDTHGSSIKPLNKEEEWVGSIEKTYTILINGKNKKFSTEKQFLKLYPKQKAILKKYITDKNTDFNVVMQVLDLYNYTKTL